MHLNEKKYQELKLIALLKQDSEYAFQLIYDHYRNRIYKLAVLYLKSPVLAQEAVQDIFLKLWFFRKDLHTETSIEPWLLTVSKNYLLNQLKSIAHQWIKIDDAQALENLAENYVEDALQMHEYKMHLNTAINSLSVKQKEVFLMARETGLTYKQIAEKMNTSPLTVKTHMARALTSIKTYLRENNLLSVICL